MDKNVGEKIKIARKTCSLKTGKKLTQKMLGDMIGKSQGYIGDIESGRTKPSVETLNQIANALNVDIDYFMNTNNCNDTVNYEIDPTQLNKIISAVKQVTQPKESSKLEEEYPEAMEIIKNANEKLTEEQKKKMVKLMEWFLENELPKERS